MGFVDHSTRVKAPAGSADGDTVSASVLLHPVRMAAVMRDSAAIFRGGSSIHEYSLLFQSDREDVMSSPVICDDLNKTTPGATTAAPAGQAAVSRRALPVGGLPHWFGGAETVQVDG